MISARVPAPHDRVGPSDCTGCKGSKQAPLAARIDLGLDLTFYLCEECGRDAANAIGYMCIRDGGWSKLEPRKRKAAAR